LEFVIESLDDKEFLGSQLVNGELSVGDLLHHGLHLQRLDAFVLGGHEHTRHPDDVQVVGMEEGLALCEELVHVAHRKEEGVVVALEVHGHFDFPVDHASSDRAADGVVGKWVRTEHANFSSPQICVDIISVILKDVGVLSLILSGSLSTKVS